VTWNRNDSRLYFERNTAMEGTEFVSNYPSLQRYGCRELCDEALVTLP
jgi:hypothetical protein